MSKLGFEKLLRDVDKIEKSFLKRGMKLVQKEIKTNFDKETNSETSKNWLDVERGVPPPILDVTGELKAQATHPSNIIYSKGKAVLTVDPIDIRGRGYAQYHQDGINQYRTKDSFQREFVTHSNDLENKHLKLLTDIVDNWFDGKGYFD
jgi:hypothetical protein